MADQAQELSYDNVAKAAYVLEDKVERTPVYQCPRISRIVTDAVSQRRHPRDHEIPEIELYLKCENLQTINSKYRGATYFIDQMSDDVLRRGVVAYSTGNHALSLASACKVASTEKKFPVPVVVIVPGGAPQTKVDQIREHGAKVISFGRSMSECLEMAQNIQRRAGMTLVPPSGHPHYIIGQGTVALEFLDQVQEELDQQVEDDDSVPSLSDASSSNASSDFERPVLDMLVMPSAGSGLLAGAAIACQKSGVKIIAAEPDAGHNHFARNPQLNSSQSKGSGMVSLASDLQSLVTEHKWSAIGDTDHVHGVYSASQDDIVSSLKPFFEESQMPIEANGAIALATLMQNSQLHDQIAGMASSHRNNKLRIGVVISGGNTTPEKMAAMFKPKPSYGLGSVLPCGPGGNWQTGPSPPPTPPSHPMRKIPFGSKGPLLPMMPFMPMMARKRERRQLCAKF